MAPTTCPAISKTKSNAWESKLRPHSCDFIRTLKEDLLWVRTFDTIEELRAALVEFATRYNETWLVARHGYRTPVAVRADQCRLDPNSHPRDAPLAITTSQGGRVCLPHRLDVLWAKGRLSYPKEWAMHGIGGLPTYRDIWRRSRLGRPFAGAAGEWKAAPPTSRFFCAPIPVGDNSSYSRRGAFRLDHRPYVVAKVVSHGRYAVFQVADAAIRRNLFADNLRLAAAVAPGVNG